MIKANSLSPWFSFFPRRRASSAVSAFKTNSSWHPAMPRQAVRPRAIPLHMAVFSYALIFVNIALLLFHVVQANVYAVTGYEISEQRAGLQRLEETNKKLTLELAEAASMLKVNESVVAAQHFVPVTNSEYVQISKVVSQK